jgi:hypothetical protein
LSFHKTLENIKCQRFDLRSFKYSSNLYLHFFILVQY